MTRVLVGDDHNILRRGVSRAFTSPARDGKRALIDAVKPLDPLRRLEDPSDRTDAHDALDRVVSTNAAVKKVVELVRKVAHSNATVLIFGETGTGKELIADAIHQGSPRASLDFVKVNCAALHENLLESELFGHERGAFTGADRLRIGRFEQADGGSMFLDEVGDMSPSIQAKVLRVLQEREFERLGGTGTMHVNVRMIAATNRNLSQMVRDGQFREDLYYRLNVVVLELPPLRERKEDIPALARMFIKRRSGELDKRIDGLDEGALRRLMQYSWPGNIRELESAILRAAVFCEHETLEAGDFVLGEETGLPPAGDARVVNLPPGGIAWEEIERQVLVEALTISDWIPGAAASFLHLPQEVFDRKIRALNIDVTSQP
jgi:transcriptional regulator with GAF, ATPase, and Fis domain